MQDQAFPEAKIAVFENRVILRTQPPVTADEIARIEAQLTGPIPPGLRELWGLCYGGRLDYDMEVAFGEHVYPFSFTTLFSPSDSDYRSLDEWIEREREALQEGGGEPPRLDYLPFGGFEYLERVYVCVRPDDYGAVYAYAQGIPGAWTLNLHQDSITRIASDVRGLFRLLDLQTDPRTITGDDYASGMDALAAIDEAAAEGTLDAADAGRLKDCVIGAVGNWRAALDIGTLALNPRLSRIALQHAAVTGDLALLDRIAGQGVDPGFRLTGGGSALDHALAHDRTEMAAALLDRGVKGGGQTMQCAASCASPELLERLRSAGAHTNEYAILAAARAGNIEGARLMARWLFEAAPGRRQRLVESVIQAAEGARDAGENQRLREFEAVLQGL